MEGMYAAVWAGLVIGLAGLWVGYGQSLVWKTSIDILGKNPRLADTLRIYTLLGIALVETAIIYALVIAFRILGDDTLTTAQIMGAAIAMGSTAFIAWIGEGKMVATALESVNRNPDNKSQVLQFMILFLALIETVAVYGLIISFQILSK